MSHIHKFSPGANVTFSASADITAGRVLEVTGSREVAHAGAASAKVIGAAATDAKDGDDVLVLRGGVQTLVASAAIPAGSRIITAAAGKVAAAGAGVTGFGIAITAATAADQPVDVALD